MKVKVFGRFSPYVSDFSKRNEKIKLRTYKNAFKKRKFVLVGVDPKKARVEGMGETTHEDLFEIIENSVDVTFVIGTVREFVFIGEGVYERKIRDRILVLEETTVVKRESYEDDAEKNLNSLKEEWDTCRKVYDAERNVTLYNYLRKTHHPEAKKRFGFKSSLDSLFFFAQRGAHAENFVYRETRKGRKIAVFDVNSMYPYCITLENYPDPSRLVHETYPDPSEWGAGIFLVLMERKKTMDAFPERFSYLKYAKDNVRFHVDVPEETKILTVLHKNEMEFFSEYYEIDPLEGIVSEKAVAHPLKETMEELYRKRSESEGYERKLYKSMMVMASSLYMKNSFKRLKSEREWVETVTKKFGIKNVSNFYRGLYFSRRSVPDVHDPRNVYLLGSQMYANNNVHLARILEKLYFSGLDVEICYVNVDSVHVSVSEKDYNALMELMYPQVGTELGKLKVEAVSDHAFWFDVGKYVLFDRNGEIVKKAGMDRFLSYTVEDGAFRKVKYDPMRALSYGNRVSGDPSSPFVPAERVSLAEAERGINLLYDLKDSEEKKRIALYKEYRWLTRK